MQQPDSQQKFWHKDFKHYSNPFNFDRIIKSYNFHYLIWQLDYTERTINVKNIKYKKQTYELRQLENLYLSDVKFLWQRYH